MLDESLNQIKFDQTISNIMQQYATWLSNGHNKLHPTMLYNAPPTSWVT